MYQRNSPASAFIASRQPAVRQIDLARAQAVGQIIDAQRLNTLSPDARSADPEIMRRAPQAVYDGGNYGDEQIIPAVFTGAGERLVLGRPKNVRIYLEIQNQLAAANIWYAFDQVAGPGNGIIILPGQTKIWDARVPQNDLHIFAAALGTVMVGFINTDIVNAH